MGPAGKTASAVDADPSASIAAAAGRFQTPAKPSEIEDGTTYAACSSASSGATAGGAAGVSSWPGRATTDAGGSDPVAS